MFRWNLPAGMTLVSLLLVNQATASDRSERLADEVHAKKSVHEIQHTDFLIDRDRNAEAMVRRFRQQSTLAVGFANGKPTQSRRTAFFQLYDQWEGTACVRQLLEDSVPPIAAGRFVVRYDLDLSNFVTPSGGLCLHPMIDSLSADEWELLSQPLQRVEGEWTRLLRQIQVHGYAESSTVASFEHSLRQLTMRFEERFRNRDDPSAVTVRRQLDCLTRHAKDLRRQDYQTLVLWKAGGTSFHGGKVADLIEFLRIHPVAVRRNESCAMKLAQIAYQMSNDHARQLGLDVPEPSVHGPTPIQLGRRD